MPVAVHYRTKSVSGEKMLSSMKNSVSTIQTCERCLKRKQSEKHIVTRETSNCISLCEDCFCLIRICVFGISRLSREWSGISHPITESMQYLPEAGADPEIFERGDPEAIIHKILERGGPNSLKMAFECSF